MRLVVAEPPITTKSKPKARKPKRSLFGQVVLVLLGAQLLFFSSFSAWRIPTATAKNLTNYAHNLENSLYSKLPQLWQERVQLRFPALVEQLSQPKAAVRKSGYTPQVPVCIFLGYVLGFPMATAAAVLAFAVGMAGPFLGLRIFAEGGGMDYWQQPSFGYLLGMVLATWVVGIIASEKRTSIRQILGVAAGLAVVHVTGLVYMLGTPLVAYLIGGLHAEPEWQPWVFEQARNFTWYPLPYDAIFALVAMGIGFPFKWLVNLLTAPDIVFRPKNNFEQRRLEELLDQ